MVANGQAGIENGEYDIDPANLVGIIMHTIIPHNEIKYYNDIFTDCQSCLAQV